MAEKKVVRYKLVRHKWPDEIQAEKKRRQRRMCIVATCIVCFFGGFFLNSTLHQTAAASRDEFQKLEEIYSIMSDKFYFGKNQKNLNQKLIDGAISGLVDAGGDIHTSYLDNEQTESFTGSMEGSFVGIGIQFYGVDDSTFIIDEVLKNSPAEGAGFLMGDQIYAIDGTVCRNMTTSDVKALITNSKSDEITLEIIRENRHKKVKVKKATVQDSVYSGVNGKTGILELDTFAETSGEEVKSHLESLKKDGCENLILDLRGNTGGYLKSAQEIASYLLPDNTVIFREETKDGTKEDYKTISGYEQYKYKKIVVLVNGDTASAAATNNLPNLFLVIFISSYYPARGLGQILRRLFHLCGSCAAIIYVFFKYGFIIKEKNEKKMKKNNFPKIFSRKLFFIEVTDMLSILPPYPVFPKANPHLFCRSDRMRQSVCR